MGGNSSTCSQTITVVDATPPVLSGVPANTNYQCLADVPAPAPVTATDNCDTNVTVSLSATTNGTCPTVIVRTWTATDACTNSASASQTNTVNDTIPPTITCPQDITVMAVSNVPPCPGSLAQFLAEGGTATDNCDTNLTYACSDGPLVGTVCGGMITRTHTVTDDCTNSASCTQTIRISDQTPPTITCPSNITVQCLADVPPCPTNLAGFQAAGGSVNDTNVTYRCTDGPLVGGICGGTITRTHTVFDECTNSASCTQIITVNDTTPPTITCPANFSVQCLGNVPPCPTNLAVFLGLGGTASDNCDSNLTYSCSDGPLTGGICGGTITRTHKVTDDCTNMATCVQIITVHDTIPPTITCPQDITVMAVSNVPPCPGSLPQFLAEGGTATDNCDTNLTYQCMDGPLVGTECGGMIMRTHTVTDSCTNSASCTQTIRISDQTPPTITCPSNITVQCLADVPPCPTNLAGFQAAGGSVNDTNVTYRCTDGPLVGDTCGGTITRTHTVTDDCTNSASCQQVITVRDTIPPRITCPNNITSCVANVTFPIPMATDDCAPAPQVTCTPASGSTFSVGTTTVTCTAQDACTNRTSCSFTITVRSATMVTGPQDQMVGQGTNVTFCVMASGAGPFTFQWCKDDMNIAGATNSCLTLTNVQAADAGRYCAKVSHPCGTVTSCATLTVKVCTPPTAVGPTNGLVCEGMSAVFCTVADGTGPFTYQWFRNGAPIAGATNPCFTTDTPGQYCVRITGACGSVTNCATAILATIHIITMADPPEGGSSGGDIFATNGQPVMAVATPNSGFLFLNWTENKGVVTTSAVYSFTATANRTLVAHFAREYGGSWKLDDGGTTAMDSSGSGNHGRLTNGPTFTAAGRVGGALSFDGVNDWVTVPDADSLEFANRKFTVALWVKTTKNGPQALIEKQHNSFSGFFLLAINRDNVSSTRGAFSIWTGNTWIDSNFRGLTNGQWHHLAVTFDGATFRLYRDGMLDQTKNATASYGLTSFPLNFGRFATENVGWPFQGMLDEILCASRALSLSEIAALAGQSQPIVLTVASVNPSSGVPITVSPNDTNGQGNGTTLFTRSYPSNTVVTLTAPATASGNNFQKWQRDGADYSTSLTTNLTLDANRTMTAIYQAAAPTTRTLTVVSTPNSGVSITVSPNATNGQGNGTTLFTRVYSNNTLITLTAPTTASGNNFQKWQRDGADYSTSLTTTLTMDTNRTLTAVYAATNSTNNAGLVGYWKFNDGSGLTELDSSGLGHHGALTNGPVFTNGLCAGALFFDGNNDFVRVPDADLLDFNGKNFTVALRVKTTKSGPQALVEKEHTSFSGFFLWALNRDNAVPGGFSVWSGANWIDSNFRGVSDGQWHHLAVSFDGTRFRLYRDGILDKTVTAGASYVNTTLPLNFGRFGTANAGWPFAGLLDEVRRYNRALSDAEVAGLTNCPAAIGLASSLAGRDRARVELRITRVTVLENDHVSLRATGEPGRTYYIQASTTLQNWSTIATAVAGPDGSLEFTDSDATESPARFYRVVAP